MSTDTGYQFAVSVLTGLVPSLVAYYSLRWLFGWMASR
jgi:hypothetical protein